MFCALKNVIGNVMVGGFYNCITELSGANVMIENVPFVMVLSDLIVVF